MDLNKNGKNDFKELLDWFLGLFDFNHDDELDFSDFTFLVAKAVDYYGDKDGKIELEDLFDVLSKAGVAVKDIEAVKELAKIFGDGKLDINDCVSLWHLLMKFKK